MLINLFNCHDKCSLYYHSHLCRFWQKNSSDPSLRILQFWNLKVMFTSDLFQPDAEVVSQNVSLSFKNGLGFKTGKLMWIQVFHQKTLHDYSQIFFPLLLCWHNLDLEDWAVYFHPWFLCNVLNTNSSMRLIVKFHLVWIFHQSSPNSFSWTLVKQIEFRSLFKLTLSYVESSIKRVKSFLLYFQFCSKCHKP